MPPRALAAPLHKHTREDEYSYVLDRAHGRAARRRGGRGRARRSGLQAARPVAHVLERRRRGVPDPRDHRPGGLRGLLPRARRRAARRRGDGPAACRSSARATASSSTSTASRGSASASACASSRTRRRRPDLQPIPSATLSRASARWRQRATPSRRRASRWGIFRRRRSRTSSSAHASDPGLRPRTVGAVPRVRGHARGPVRAHDVRGLRRHLLRPGRTRAAWSTSSTAAGGSADFATEVETTDVLNLLHRRRATASCPRRAPSGPATAAGTSRTRRSPTNPDLARLARLHAHLVATTAVDATTPLVGIGMSNGARFVTLWGQTWKDAGYPVKAIWASMGRIAGPVSGAGAHRPHGLLHRGERLHLAAGPIIAGFDLTRRPGRPPSCTSRGTPAHRPAVPADPRRRPVGGRRDRAPAQGHRRVGRGRDRVVADDQEAAAPAGAVALPASVAARPTRSATRPHCSSPCTSSPPSSRHRCDVLRPASCRPGDGGRGHARGHFTSA